MKKLIIRSAIYFLILYILSILLRGFNAAPSILIGGAVVLALFNTLLRPLLNVLALPVNILTLGIGVILVNMLTILITNGIFEKISITGFWTYVAIAISIMIADGLVRNRKMEKRLS